VAGDITATRAALRARHGWIMDTYLLRRDQEERGGPGSASGR
jgi:precorrin-6A synthase